MIDRDLDSGDGSIQVNPRKKVNVILPLSPELFARLFKGMENKNLYEEMTSVFVLCC